MDVMRKVEIIREIDVAVFNRRGTIDRWHVGVTDDAEETKRALTAAGHDVSRWHAWMADTVREAKVIGRLFVTLGMRPNVSYRSRSESSTVYVF
jgi:hypothetical protein